MKKEQRMMLQGGVTYEKESPERKVYIANLMYRYPEETETIELIPAETIVYNNSFGRTNGIVEQGRLRDIREEQEIRAREARLQRRNTPEKPARERIDYINKVGNVKDFGVPQVNENIVMKAKTKKIQTPSKDYNEIASLMYPTMEEKSQIQVKKKEPMLLGESSVLEEPDMITLADKENEVKPIDKKEENKDKEMKIEQVLDEKEIIQKENKDVSLNQNVKETFEFIQKNGFAPKKKLSNNIYWSELIKTNSLKYEKPTISDLNNLYVTALILQKFHDDVYPSTRINIHSGWRSKGYNATIKGAATKSAHLEGKAIDFDLGPDISPDTLRIKIVGWGFKGRKRSYKTFLHIDIRTSNKGYSNDW